VLFEVGPALQRDHIHEIEWVGDVVNLVVSERYEAVSNKLNILTHQSGVHANEFA
jgi:hypothetical protein